MTPAPAAALAVVIVNYNTGGLARPLPAVARGLPRRSRDVDVVVIDNDSHDGSADAAIAAVPGARLVRNETNRYLSPAWNQGAALTDAPYLLFLNPDTEWFHGTLEDLVRVARDASAGRDRRTDGAQPRRHRLSERPAIPERGRRDGARVRLAGPPGQRVHAPLPHGRVGSERPSARSTG